MAQSSTGEPTNSAVKEQTAAATGETVTIKKETAQACDAAFERVENLEKAVADLLDGRKLDQAEIDRLKLFITDLQSNFNDSLKEKNTEIVELRKALIELVKIARKRTKICLIC